MSEPMTLDEYLNEAKKPPGERALYNDPPKEEEDDTR